MYSLRMSAWTVPESRLRSQPRLRARATYMARRIRVVGVVAHEGRHVEVHAEPRLPLFDQVAEAAVGVLARPEARDLAHGPEAPAVHGGIRPTRVRVLPRQAEVFLAQVLDVFGRVDPLEREARQRSVFRAGFRS